MLVLMIYLQNTKNALFIRFLYFFFFFFSLFFLSSLESHLPLPHLLRAIWGPVTRAASLHILINHKEETNPFAKSILSSRVHSQLDRLLYLRSLGFDCELADETTVAHVDVYIKRKICSA